MIKKNTFIYIGAALALYFLFRKKTGIGTLSATYYDPIDNFTIDELNSYIQRYFPDTFKAEAYESTGVYNQLRYDLDRPAPKNVRFSWDDRITYKMFQGDENTYFNWWVYGSNNKEYIISYGMKDRGDVNRETVTSFLNWLLSRHKSIKY